MTLTKGRYRARLAVSQGDTDRVQALRWLAFRAGIGDRSRAGRDRDDFDAHCRHVLIEECSSGRTVACFRLMLLASGKDVARTYAAQFYDLAPLFSYGRRMVEVGRFCLHPENHDPDILRIAWGMLTRYADQEWIGMLFGCTSFAGIDHTAYLEAFALLRERHLGPVDLRPGIRAPEVIRFASVSGVPFDTTRALKTLPPLLRTYLSMGGWVSDHAVVDRDLQTLHVFTGLETARIPSTRARLLRLIAT